MGRTLTCLERLTAKERGINPFDHGPLHTDTREHAEQTPAHYREFASEKA